MALPYTSQNSQYFTIAIVHRSDGKTALREDTRRACGVDHGCTALSYFLRRPTATPAPPKYCVLEGGQGARMLCGLRCILIPTLLRLTASKPRNDS